MLARRAFRTGKERKMVRPIVHIWHAWLRKHRRKKGTWGKRRSTRLFIFVGKGGLLGRRKQGQNEPRKRGINHAISTRKRERELRQKNKCKRTQQHRKVPERGNSFYLRLKGEDSEVDSPEVTIIGGSEVAHQEKRNEDKSELSCSSPSISCTTN